MAGEIIHVFEVVRDFVILNPLPVATIGSLCVGFILGKLSKKKPKPESLEEENEKLDRELKIAKTNLRSLENNQDIYNRTIDRLTSERDRFKDIAETHDVRIPEFKDREYQASKIWNNRLYCDLPNENLKNLERDLKGTGEEFFSVRIKFEALGGWKFDPFTVKRQGTLKQIHSEITALMLDVDYDLVRNNYNGRKVWKDGDSPIRMIVSVDAIREVNHVTPENIRVVEVAVTSTEFEVIEVEKPVFIDDDKDEVPGLVPHTKEEIVKIIREYDLRKEAEREVESITTPADEHLKRMRQAHSVKAKQ